MKKLSQLQEVLKFKEHCTLRFFFLIWLAVSAVSAATPTLNLFIWSEYIDPALVREFEKKFNAALQIDLYEDAESMLAKVQSSGKGTYDLVVVPDYLVPAMIHSKLLDPLRPAKLPNLKNLEARFRNPPFDRGNQFSAAYQWGTVGVYVRLAGPKPPPATWGLIFDPKQQAGPLGLIDSMRDLLGAALKYKGKSLNSVDPQDLREARDLIIETKKRAASLDGSVAAKNKVLGRMLNTAIVYSGEAARGISEDGQTAYLVPAEGSQIWVDNMVVCAGSRQRDLAEQFINFILDPEIGARLAKFTQFATPNEASRKLLPPAVQNNPGIYPPPEIMAKLEYLNDLGKATQLYDEIWTQIKTR